MSKSKRHRRNAQRSPNAEPASARWTRWVAWLLCAITFPLLWLGGLVTTTKSGMAVPDWPGTYGYNLFLYPWTTWLFGPWDLFVEHGHRLLASLSGLVTIVLLVMLYKYESRPWMKTVGVVALVAVIAQGVLGGLRVVLDERLLAMVHGSVGPLFFVLTVAMVVWTSRSWLTARKVDQQGLARLAPLAAATGILVYVQMVVGAMLRHMPVTVSPYSFESVVKVHLVLATVVLMLTLVVARMCVASAAPTGVRCTGWSIIAVVLLQISLGVATWISKYGVPVWARGMYSPSSQSVLADGWWQAHIVTAHQAVGSALLASLVVATMLAWRYAPASIVNTETESFSKGVATG
ncbi:COX15/CtaA family protein [Aeoliella sp. ICT_H6.2]|uniref:COX15/CtaA family protein n=1 Tax=Aeoliella straminimaris TaxID=2954799 RepID=A0A9X2FCG5_9BACT|nr:COX15/CtaA family protein [Aeoliella straminimaris]MCO6045502.1 COX15/CtaA family protein [Aeoliella straminimaris]